MSEVFGDRGSRHRAEQILVVRFYVRLPFHWLVQKTIAARGIAARSRPALLLLLQPVAALRVQTTLAALSFLAAVTKTGDEDLAERNLSLRISATASMNSLSRAGCLNDMTNASRKVRLISFSRSRALG